MAGTGLTMAVSNTRRQRQDCSGWRGTASELVRAEGAMQALLHQLDESLLVIQDQDGLALTQGGECVAEPDTHQRVVARVAGLTGKDFGDSGFCETYGVKLAYYAGAMANGISSEEMVIALGRAGILASFGAAGCSPDRLEAAIQRIQTELPQGPYAFNLIHSPYEADLEANVVQLYLEHGVHVVEASAFLDMTTAVVRFRACGLSRRDDGSIEIRNRIIAKLSRTEVAQKFMRPAPQAILDKLLADGAITAEQADLATRVPVADDITVEADSGGHTDNRPLVGLLPTMLALRDQIQAEYDYAQPVRVGAAGGISTPESALAAFMMGAAYIVTGSVNHACVEAGTSEHTRKLLAQAEMADVIMAPSADMFEMGVKVQVLKRGTLYPMRAQKLYDVYKTYESLEQIPADVRVQLETQLFKRSLEEIWQETCQFFETRDPTQIAKAETNPRKKMALVFRWYLGLASHWSTSGAQGREMDYQIWCGPAMGTFNDWVRGTYLEPVENRHVVEIANHILTGAVYLYRIRQLELQGIQIPSSWGRYLPAQA